MQLSPIHPSLLEPLVLPDGEATTQPISSPKSPSPFPSIPHALLPLVSTFPGMMTQLGQALTPPRLACHPPKAGVLLSHTKIPPEGGP